MQEALGHIQVSINLASIQSQLFGRSHLHVVGRGRLLMDHWRVARGATLNIAGVFFSGRHASTDGLACTVRRGNLVHNPGQIMNSHVKEYIRRRFESFRTT